MKKHRFQAVCEGTHRYKVGGALLNFIKIGVSMSITTTKLIQCGNAEMSANKAFQGVGEVGYWILGVTAVKWIQSCLALCTSF